MQVPRLIANVCHLQEHVGRHFALHAQAVRHAVRLFQIRINRRDAEYACARRRAATRIAEIAELKDAAARPWRIADFVEDHVAFRRVVEHAEAAANRHFAVVRRLEGKTKTRSPCALRREESAWRSVWESRGALILRQNQTIERIAALSGINTAVRLYSHGLCRIVQ